MPISMRSRHYACFLSKFVYIWLQAHLDEVETHYQEQARKIIDEYVALFEKITPTEEKE